LQFIPVATDHGMHDFPSSSIASWSSSDFMGETSAANAALSVLRTTPNSASFDASFFRKLCASDGGMGVNFRNVKTIMFYTITKCGFHVYSYLA
jgi:hypothetical protein